MFYEGTSLVKFGVVVKTNRVLSYQVELRTDLSIPKTFLVVAKHSVSNSAKYP
jgi:hypothetical protein